MTFNLFTGGLSELGNVTVEGVFSLNWIAYLLLYLFYYLLATKIHVNSRATKTIV